MRKLSHYPSEFPEVWASGWGQDHYGLWMAFVYQGIELVFRWLEPGTFVMGSPTSEAERFDDETPHTASISQGFWLAETTVTQGLWQVVMGNNPSHFKGDNLPVEQVSWHDALAFIDKLNILQPELALCLPTEAQWEYACRAGSQTPFSFGEQIDASQVNFNGGYPYNNGAISDYRAQTVAVKSLPANAWGLYEMHGNVREWCDDIYGAYPSEPVTDPRGAETGDLRVLRGGAWNSFGRLCRSAYRLSYQPDYASGTIGFRLSRGQKVS